MKVRTKIILLIGVFVLLILASMTGAAIYYYTHPSAVKRIVEYAVKSATGTSFAIKDLTYSLTPLRIAANGITCQPGKTLRGFYLEIPDVAADLSLEGPFGHKTLTFKRLQINGFSCRIAADSTLPKIKAAPQGTSFLGAVLKKAIAYFLFRDVRLEDAEVSGGRIAAQLEDQTVRVSGVHARLNAEQLIEVSCGIEMAWPSKKALLSVPHLHAKTDRAISLVDPRIGCSITVKDAVFESPDAKAKNIRLEAGLLYQSRHRNLTFENINLSLREADIKRGAQRETVLLDLHLNTAGAFSLKDLRLTASPLSLTMGDRLQFTGELDAAVGSQKKLDLKIRNCRVTPQEMFPLLPTEIRRRLDPLKLSGPVHVTGRIGGVMEQEKWGWECDLQARFKQTQVSFTPGHSRFGATVSGDIRAEGRVPDLRISVMVNATHTEFSGNGVELKPSEAAVSFSGTYPVFDLKDLSFRIPRAKGELGKKEFLVDDIRLQVQKGRVNGDKQAIFLPEIQFDSSLLKNLKGSLEVNNGKITIGVRGNQTGLIKAAMDLDLLPAGWGFAGLDSVQIGVGSEDEGGWSFMSELAFRDFAFQNRDSSCMGEKVSLRAKIGGRIDPSGLRIAANTSVDADKGEVLYDRFYVDLKKTPFFSLCEGAYGLSDSHLLLSNLQLGLKDILTLQTQGSILKRGGDWDFDLSSNIPKVPLEPVFNHFISEPFRRENPALAEIDVAGTISADLRVTGRGTDWLTKGYFKWDDGGLSSAKSGISLNGIDLSLPVWYQNREVKDPGTRLKGRLSIRSAGLPLLSEQELALSLDGGPNLLAVNASTFLKIPGGKIRLGPVVIRGLYGRSPSVDTSLSIDHLEIGPLLAGVWTHSVQGTISGELDPIHFERGNLKSVGEIMTKVLGGEVILSDPSVSGLLTGIPVFKLSTRWKDINLSELTAGTSFGKIEGILEGYAKGLEISHGQPQKFGLLLETVQKDGVPQRISVKAVDNIAQLGGGQSPFIGVAGMFASLFKEFPYEKIGVRATLENDIFRINGTIKEEGKEYLVKRGLLSGVNVVNQNPDNRVSFKDMVKRIKRVTASKSGPIIK